MSEDTPATHLPIPPVIEQLKKEVTSRLNIWLFLIYVRAGVDVFRKLHLFSPIYIHRGGMRNELCELLVDWLLVQDLCQARE